MPIRTSAPEVCAIIDTELEPDEVLPFILPASLVIDEHLVITPAINDDLLLQIETWLTAHMVTVFDPRTASEEADHVKLKFEGTTGMGLNSSKYGQMAKFLDPTGKLADLDNPTKKSFTFRIGNETDVENV